MMKMIIACLLLLSALASLATSETLLSKNNPNPNIPNYTVSREHFSRLLRTAFDDEVTLNHLDRRLLQESDVWLETLNFGVWWTQQSSHHRALRPDTTDSEPNHPFVLCSQARKKSGNERLRLLAQSLGISVERSQTVSNTDEESCFMVSVTSSTIQTAYEETEMSNSSLTPLVDVMKIASGGVSYILDDTEWQPTAASAGGEELSKTTHVASLMVDLIPSDEVSAVAATQILNDVIAMIQASNSILSSSNLRSFNNNPQLSNIVSIRDAFSLTSSMHSNNNNKHLRSLADNNSVWSEALLSGFEASHGCKNMFDLIQVRERGAIDGFELLLNAAADTVENDGTVWNKSCVISLIIALSVNSAVLSVEVGRPLETSSFEETSSTARKLAEGITNPQWIIQSGIVDQRPFFDHNLDGRGQTVGVADAGLDTDNCYFYDSSNSEDFFGRYSWDLSQRKVVHYDDFGDQVEINSGHGTAVAAAAIGRRSFDGQDESNGYADGTAPGAKLAFLDMGVGSNSIEDPGVTRLFESLSRADKGAKVINGSWGRSYFGLYSSYCKDYDASKSLIVLIVLSLRSNTHNTLRSSITR